MSMDIRKAKNKGLKREVITSILFFLILYS